MSAPRLSVVMPSFGHVDQVEGALEAIFAQSRVPDEVLVVDDCSVDGSRDLVDKLTYRWGQLYQVASPLQEGPAMAARRGFYASTGDLVHFTAADDRVLPGFYEWSLAALESAPEAALSCCLVRNRREPPKGARGHVRAPAPLLPGYWSPADLRRRRLSISGAAAILRRAPYLRAGGYLPELRSACDWFCHVAMAQRDGLVLVPEVLVEVDVGETYSTTRSGPEEEAIRSAINYLVDSPEYADVREGLLAEMHWQEALAR